MTEKEARKYISELFDTVSTTSILILDREGNVRRLYCPFKVVAILDIPPQISEGKSYLVEAVKMTIDLKQVFIIERKGYYFWCFLIT